MMDTFDFEDAFDDALDNATDDYAERLREKISQRMRAGLSSPIDKDAPVWITRDFRTVPLKEMGANHLANTIAYVERRTDAHPQREAWLAILNAEQKRRFDAKAEADPTIARVSLLEIDK